MKQDEEFLPTENSSPSYINLIPEHWPEDVRYLDSHSIPSATLPAHLVLHLCTPPKQTNEFHPSQVRIHEWTRIKEIFQCTPFQPAFESTLTCHPTLGQFGLFARRNIPPHTLVVPYLGQIHLASEEDAESRYDAAVEADDFTKCGIDATNAGNEARFVNDYRGILQRPNLFFKDWTARFPPQMIITFKTDNETVRFPKKVKGLALYSGAHEIKKGTELCASYGKGWWAARSG